MRILKTKALFPLLTLCGVATLGQWATAAEGMWTLHNLPMDRMQAVGFTPSQEWIDNARLASVRLNDGGSGSFVSPDGLLLSNHHVAMGQLSAVSSPEKDYVKNGFFARQAEEELPCKDLEVNILVSMENVTARVQGAVKEGATTEEAGEQRKAERSLIEKESKDATGLRSNVVELYQGGEYWLYRYKQFTDVRLVMAPEHQAAFFGGDLDNFTYPRHDSDFAFFRVYENGQPYKSEHYFPWSQIGLKQNELAFVTGHPGSTERLHTLAQLQTIRDLINPFAVDGLVRMRDTLEAYGKQGSEQERQREANLRSVTNSLKVYEGRVAAMKNPALMEAKVKEEKDLRDAVERNPAWRAKYGQAWTQIEETQKRLAARSNEYYYRRLGGVISGGGLANLAKTIVTYVEQAAKPNEKRWPEFRDSSLDSLRQKLFSTAPIYPGMEKKLLAEALKIALKKLGPQDPFIVAALAGRTPEETAQVAISGTKLLDAEYRKQLVAGGLETVKASEDPLIQLAVKLTPFIDEMRTWYEKCIEAAEVAGKTLIAQARFAVYGKTQYPDATFTLRLSYGKAAGYEQGTTLVPYKTTFGGLFDRAKSFDYKPPYDLPAKIMAARGKIDMDTPLNFVTTNDIIGGNSGSPVINKEGELVGLIFDGNIDSLMGDFLFDETKNRAVAVHSAAILEALTKIYDMGGLAAALTQGAIRRIQD